MHSEDKDVHNLVLGMLKRFTYTHNQDALLCTRYTQRRYRGIPVGSNNTLNMQQINLSATTMKAVRNTHLNLVLGGFDRLQLEEHCSGILDNLTRLPDS